MAKIRRKGERGGEVTGPQPETVTTTTSVPEEFTEADVRGDVTTIEKPKRKAKAKAKARKASR